MFLNKFVCFINGVDSDNGRTRLLPNPDHNFFPNSQQNVLITVNGYQYIVKKSRIEMKSYVENPPV